MSYSRRDLSLLLPALAAATAGAQEKDKKLLPSKVFKYEDLPVKVNGQNKARAGFNGETHQGYAVELHITELGPGMAPHAPHKHVHEELLLLQTGTLEATVNGQTTVMTPGSFAYMASNDLHGWRNTGSTPAQYFVIAIGGNG